MDKARPPKVKTASLDGISYLLARVSNGQEEIVYQHSPQSESRSAKVIAVLKLLTDNFLELDEDASLVDKIESEIDKLIEL